MIRRVLALARPSAVSWLLFAVLAVLVVVPLALVGLAGLTGTVPRPGDVQLGGFTLSNFEVLASPVSRRAVVTSVVVGLATAVLAVVVGGLLAFLAARSNLRWKPAVYAVGILPLFLPSYVGALAWSVLASPRSGLLNVVARDVGVGAPLNVYGVVGLVFVLTLYYVPYAFGLIHGALSLMNPDHEDAASCHGASRARVLTSVTIPLLTPAVLGSFVLVFVLSVDNLPVAQLLGAPANVQTLPTLVYRLMGASRGNEASAIAIVLTVLLLVATGVQQRVVARRDFATVSGKGLRPRSFAIGAWAVPAWVLVAGYFLCSVVLPVLALFVKAMRTSPYVRDTADLLDPRKLSGEPFADILREPVFTKALGNSVLVGLLAAAVGTALSFVVAYLVYRTKTPGRRLLEYLSMSPLAVPGVVLGMGLLWTWLLVPIPIYGTLAILVVAFVAVQLPQGHRGLSASIMQIHPELEESALVHGARRSRAVGYVTVPLLRAGLTSTFILLLMLSLRELTVPLFLFTSDTELLSIVIFHFFESGVVTKAAAGSLLYTAVIVALAIAAQVLGNRTQGASSRTPANTGKVER